MGRNEDVAFLPNSLIIDFVMAVLGYRELEQKDREHSRLPPYHAHTFPYY